MFTVNVYNDLTEVTQRLDRIERHQHEILTLLRKSAQRETNMAGRITEIDDLINQVNQTTNEMGTNVGKVSSKIDDLVAKLEAQAANGLTPEDTTKALDELRGLKSTLAPIAENLKNLGADSTNPVPDPVPVPDPAPEPTPDTPDEPTDQPGGPEGRRRR